MIMTASETIAPVLATDLFCLLQLFVRFLSAEVLLEIRTGELHGLGYPRVGDTTQSADGSQDL